MTVHIGIGLFTGQIPPGSDRTFEQEYREVLDLVRLAETLGFDSAWVSEHHGSSDGYLPSLLPILAAFAVSTVRFTRSSTGWWNIRNSSSRQPRPSPRMSRPPES